MLVVSLMFGERKPEILEHWIESQEVWILSTDLLPTSLAGGLSGSHLLSPDLICLCVKHDVGLG